MTDVERSVKHDRVTSEDVVRAIEAIEARKGKTDDSRVNVSDILAEMRLDITKDELVQEIIQGRKSSATTRERRNLRRLSIGATCLLIAVVLFAVYKYQTRGWHMEGRTKVYTSSVPIATLPANENRSDVVDIQFDRSSIVRNLADAPDEVPMAVSWMTIDRLLREGGADATKVDIRPNTKGPWTVIKHSGAVYICGWTSGRHDNARITNGRIVVYAHNDGPELYKPVPICLRCGNVQAGGVSTSGPAYGVYESSFMTYQVKPDQYLWDNWPHRK